MFPSRRKSTLDCCCAQYNSSFNFWTWLYCVELRWNADVFKKFPHHQLVSQLFHDLYTLSFFLSLQSLLCTLLTTKVLTVNLNLFLESHIVWKLPKSVSFEFFDFGLIHQLTCLVTLIDCKLQVFKKLPNWPFRPLKMEKWLASLAMLNETFSMIFRHRAKYSSFVVTLIMMMTMLKPRVFSHLQWDLRVLMFFFYSIW